MVKSLSKRVIEGRAVSTEPWYNNYRAMMDRCYREKAANYPQYGGRGIKVCPGWHHIEIFEAWALENGYKPGLTLDRIDSDGDYTPANCRWVTPKQQANNRRNTIYVTIDGISKTLSEWADFAGLNRSTVSNRYHDGVRGVMLLHRAENTEFKQGHNRYGDSRHYDDYAPTIIEADLPKEE